MGGPNFGNHQLVSLGAVVERSTLDPKFEVRIQPPLALEEMEQNILDTNAGQQLF